jgi:hypothetical protein
MIAKVVRGRGFGGLARYLESGRTGLEAGRIAWAEARNLPSAHPRDAALFMRVTAAEAPQVQRPVYHLSLAWDPSDRVNRAQIVAVADRVLRELGLDGHQALLIAHRDTEHPHVHLMVNRVHPETGRAWAGRHDYQALEQILRPLEREFGFREVPGHHGRFAGQEPPDRSQALSTGELRRWERTGRVPFGELVRGEVAGDFAEAASWMDLEARLARRGLRLQPRGRGMVVTDGQEWMKCSALARGAGRAQLEKRFGVRYVEFRRQREPSRETEGRDGRTNQGDGGGRGQENRCGERSEDPGRRGSGNGRLGTSSRADGAGRGSNQLAAGGDGRAGDGRRSHWGNGCPDRPLVDQVKSQLEQLQRVLDARAGERRGQQKKDMRVGPLEHELHRAIQVAIGALTPLEVHRVRMILTNPHRALFDGIIRGARALLLDYDRER